MNTVVASGVPGRRSLGGGGSRTCTGAIVLLTTLTLQVTAGTASAQLAQPNAAGVAMGHIHYTVKDVEAHKRFWMSLGGRSVTVANPGTSGASSSAPAEAILFPDVLVLLTPGAPSGGSDGSVVSHVAFRVPSFEDLEKRGLQVQRLRGFPGVGTIAMPDGERLEVFENAATNLTFTQDAGYSDAVAERHNRPLTAPIAFHHIHLYVPADAVQQAKAWYTKAFGGVPGRRSQYDAVDLPGVNINISAAPKPAGPTRGRMLDHIGFEVTNLEALCRRLSFEGLTFVEPYAKRASGIATATLVDPWGTTIELTEGLRR